MKITYGHYLDTEHLQKCLGKVLLKAQRQLSILAMEGCQLEENQITKQ